MILHLIIKYSIITQDTRGLFIKFPTAETAEELIFGHSLYVFNGRKQILRAEEKYDILNEGAT